MVEVLGIYILLGLGHGTTFLLMAKLEAERHPDFWQAHELLHMWHGFLLMSAALWPLFMWWWFKSLIGKPL